MVLIHKLHPTATITQLLTTKTPPSTQSCSSHHAPRMAIVLLAAFPAPPARCPWCRNCCRCSVGTLNLPCFGGEALIPTWLFSWASMVSNSPTALQTRDSAQTQDERNLPAGFLPLVPPRLPHCQHKAAPTLLKIQRMPLLQSHQ